jgi:membrane-associated phospholipid phosphatase
VSLGRIVECEPAVLRFESDIAMTCRGALFEVRSDTARARVHSVPLGTGSMRSVRPPHVFTGASASIVSLAINGIACAQIACISLSASAQAADSMSQGAKAMGAPVNERAVFDTCVQGSPTRRWVLMSGAAVLATAAATTVDGRSAAFMQQSRMQNSDALQGAAKSAAFMGGPGPFLIGGSLFTLGKLTGQPHVAQLGAHVTEAVVLAATITAFGKGLSGRALPSSSNGDPDNFQLGRGFHKRNGEFVSFPSGHTAAGFAMAAVFTQEAALWHPGSERFVGPLAYGGGAVIGLARMYQNVHWASDLPLAALIGIWSGITVVRHSHTRTEGVEAESAPNMHLSARSSVARALQGMRVSPSTHGATIGWSNR